MKHLPIYLSLIGVLFFLASNVAVLMQADK